MATNRRTQTNSNNSSPRTLSHRLPSISRTCRFERLETRQLLAAGITSHLNTNDGILHVGGNDGSDRIQIRFESNLIRVRDLATNKDVPIAVTRGNLTQQQTSVSRSIVPSQVIVATGNGNNYVSVFETALNPARSITIFAGNGDDTLIGGSGNDFLFGQAGNDIIRGLQGNDVISGGDGAQDLDGGLGIDTLQESELLSATISDTRLTTQRSSRTAPSILQVMRGVERVELTASILDLLGVRFDASAYSGDTKLIGGLGNDILIGGSGADEITGGSGVDQMSGGAGNDTLTERVTNATLTDTVFANVASLLEIMRPETIGGFESARLTPANSAEAMFVNAQPFSGFMNLTGSSTNDNLQVGSGGSIVYGGGGNDDLKGGAGVDRIYGQAGNDTITGGGAADIINGGADTDTLLETNLLDSQLFNNALTTKVHDFSRVLLTYQNITDSLTSIERADLSAQSPTTFSRFVGVRLDASAYSNAATLRGGSGNDFLFGGSGNDKLYGGDGNDTLIGNAGHDGLFGGRGRNTLTGNSGADRFLDWQTNSSGVTSNSITDLTAADARIQFQDSAALTNVAPPYNWPNTMPYSFRAGIWTDREIQVIDTAFANLVNETNKTDTLKMPKANATWGEYTFIRRGMQISGDYNFGGQNSGNGTIVIGQGYDRSLSDSSLLSTVYHEIGHTWNQDPDDWIIGLYQLGFQEISGWVQTTILGFGRLPATGTVGAGEIPWYYDASQTDSDFAVSYGKLSPDEDFATTWEAYFMSQYHGATNYNLVATKQTFVNGVLDRIRDRNRA